MPSLSHELLVELFREGGELAPTLLRQVTGIELPHQSVEEASIDFSQLMPIEYRADCVLLLRDAQREVASAQIIEVQLRTDEQKRRSWPVYVSALHAKYGCDVVLCVIAPRRSVARWASEPIALGHPGFVLKPIVVAMEDVPRIVDLDIASKLPGLAILSTLAHRDLDTARTAFDVLDRFPSDRLQLYCDLILSVVTPDDRAHLEGSMLHGYVYQSDFARKYYGQGLEEGQRNGFRKALHALARAKLGALTAADKRALAVASESTATSLIRAISKARDADGVRAALAKAASKQTESAAKPARKPRKSRKS